MTSTQIQLNAFALAKPNIGKNQAKVLWAINYLNSNSIPCSDRQIANLLGWEINCVVPRRKELESMKRIFCEKVGYDGISKIKVNLWRLRGGL